MVILVSLLNSLLVLDKPQGLSSHGAVHRVRKITGIDRVGHAGTLDPMATGVLLVLLGSAVRLSEYIVDHDKKYRASVRLGIETDSYDATGKVVAEHPVNGSPDAVYAALAALVGKQDQVPPAHSAIQIQGKRAYKMARQGIALEMEPRAVEIYSITHIEFRDNVVAFDVHCSKGTYIRSLAHDLGAHLGTGAHLAALRRTASGEFTIDSSHTLQEVDAAVSAQTLPQLVLPMDQAVQHLAVAQLDAPGARAIRNGQFIPAPANLTTPLVRAYDENKQFFAILERVSSGELKPKKVLEG